LREHERVPARRDLAEHEIALIGRARPLTGLDDHDLSGGERSSEVAIADDAANGTRLRGGGGQRMARKDGEKDEPAQRSPHSHGWPDLPFTIGCRPTSGRTPEQDPSLDSNSSPSCVLPHPMRGGPGSRRRAQVRDELRGTREPLLRLA